MTDPAAVPVRFPEGFRWGVATAAFQIEGATTADGRTDSIWDTFCRQPGAVLNGDTGEPACEHYTRMPQDVDLMAGLGIGTYRFSTSWCRVRPDGGAVNPAGLDFYSRLVDRLLEAGVAPWLTLYHWDLPQALEAAGGWTNRDTAERFAEYALSVHDALGDRVGTWTTLNEPWCSSLLGYAAAVHAPGHAKPRAAVAAVHHLLLAHGLGATALREAGAGEIGLTLNLSDVSAADPDDPADADVARRLDGLQNRLFLDPVLRGSYPEDLRQDLAPFGLDDVVREVDLKVISTPLDVLGVNYYSPTHVRAGRSDLPSPWVGAEHAESVPQGLPVTAMGWEVEADALRRVLVRLHEEYPAIGAGTDLVITENGAAYDDRVSTDPVTGEEQVQDEDRRLYLEQHLRACAAAIAEGVPLRGYLAWSLLDNFEWAFGYDRRFGLVRVDYDTQLRTPKASALWFSEVIRQNGF